MEDDASGTEEESYDNDGEENYEKMVEEDEEAERIEKPGWTPLLRFRFSEKILRDSFLLTSNEFLEFFKCSLSFAFVDLFVWLFSILSYFVCLLIFIFCLPLL